MIEKLGIKKLRNNLLPLNLADEKHASLNCAAVLVPLVKDEHSNQWEVIFTRRAEQLKHHAGQISFPGGRYEEQDSDLSVTAMRETYEEIGIAADKIELIGRLPQQQTISRYNVTPFIGVISPDYRLNIDHNEVAEVFSLPLNYLIEQDNQKKIRQSYKGHEYDYYSIEYKQYNIWGLTAQILVNFSQKLKTSGNF